MDRRTEDERVRGVIPVVWGGQRKELPTLKRAAAREWREKLAAALREVGAISLTDIDAVAVAGSLVSDRLLDLVMAYDATGVLGTREWIDENVEDGEVYAAFRAILDVVFPFVADARSALAELRRLLSGPPTSTSGASGTGG